MNAFRGRGICPKGCFRACDFLVVKGRGAVGSGRSSESTSDRGEDVSDGEEQEDSEESDGERDASDIAGDAGMRRPASS
jgi:hypothetical protein